MTLLPALSIVTTGIPQAMAYAVIAGVPPIYGLYTAAVSCVIGAIFGSSRHLVTGPTNATCMVVFSLTAPYINQENHMEVIFLLTLMTGVLKLLFGLLRFGRLVRYVSNSVVMGFTTGVGILIVGNQLAPILGVTIDKEKARYFFGALYQTFLHISDINFYTVIIAAVTAAIAFSARRINKKIPGTLIGVVTTGLIVYFLNWHSHGVRILSDMAPIARSLDIFHVPVYVAHPQFALIRDLGTGAFALAIFGLIEAATSSRAIASMSGQRLDFSREFVGQGLANIVGSFFSNFASSASFIRTAECYHAGGRTRIAAMSSGIFTALTILALAPLANYIPLASLAGVLIVIAYRLVQKRRLRMTWMSGRNSQLVFLVTLLSTILLPLQYAVFVGIFMSLIFLIQVTSKPDLTQLVPRADGHFEEIPFGRAIPAPIMLVNMEGDLYFAAVENMDDELRKALTPTTRVVVLRMKRLRAVGSTAMAILERFHGMLQARGISLVVCGIEPDLQSLMVRSGLHERIEEPNIFYADNTLFRSTELAMARARNILEMERWRSEPKPVSEQIPETLELTARDLMSRNCIRFGEGHTLREAIWLISEMNRRQQANEPQPLFLQNREGRLTGMLSPWKLLREMMDGLSLDEAVALSDEELAQQFASQLDKPIGTLSQRNLPDVTLDTSFLNLFHLSLLHKLSVLPIRDKEGRVAGLVGQHDLLVGLGKLISATPPVSSPKNP